jgi:hypothetical protein
VRTHNDLPKRQQQHLLSGLQGEGKALLPIYQNHGQSGSKDSGDEIEDSGIGRKQAVKKSK